MTQRASNIGCNRLRVYQLVNASGGREWNHQRYTAWPQLVDEKPYQIGLGVAGKCVGVISSVRSVAQEMDL
jgi:hypothetical protein